MVARLFPSPGPACLPTDLGSVRAAPVRTPFDAAALEFCDRLAEELFWNPASVSHPELQALAFWLRRGAIEKLRKRFADLGSTTTRLVPRGTVFHLPPSNVDTMFVYSWMVSLLVGNRNIIRLSQRDSVQVEVTLMALSRALEAVPQVAAGTLILRYGHEAATTTQISREADVRVIWGGDQAIEQIRSSPLPAHATEMTFADRASMAAIGIEAYLQAPSVVASELAVKFFNDTYWFDQLGCSSPRIVLFVGDCSAAERAAKRFFDELGAVVRSRVFANPVGVVLEKFTHTCRAAIDGFISGVERYGNEVWVLPIRDVARLQRDTCGGGIFYRGSVPSLMALVEHVCRRDQTLTHFGLSESELWDFVRAANGRGFDRVVPVGEALAFDPIWDGFDLMSELTRRVSVKAGAAC